MPKKQMATTVKRSSVTGRFYKGNHGERLTDSIVGSLRVEGYAVKREAVKAAVLSQSKNKQK
jgi:hypothetical protein